MASKQTKLDYGKMDADDLIRLISNQALNKNINENHKLIIQDCCKELFTKKCMTYKKVHYMRMKIDYTDDPEIRCSRKVRIMPFLLEERVSAFPGTINQGLINELEKQGVINLHQQNGSGYVYTIYKVEDIM